MTNTYKITITITNTDTNANMPRRQWKDPGPSPLRQVISQDEIDEADEIACRRALQGALAVILRAGVERDAVVRAGRGRGVEVGVVEEPGLDPRFIGYVEEEMEQEERRRRQQKRYEEEEEWFEDALATMVLRN